MPKLSSPHWLVSHITMWHVSASSSLCNSPRSTVTYASQRFECSFVSNLLSTMFVTYDRSALATTKTSGLWNDCLKYTAETTGQHFLNWIKQSWALKSWIVMALVCPNETDLSCTPASVITSHQRSSPCKMDCSPFLTLPTLNSSPASWDHPSLNSRSSACHLNWQPITKKL